MPPREVAAAAEGRTVREAHVMHGAEVQGERAAPFIQTPESGEGNCTQDVKSENNDCEWRDTTMKGGHGDEHARAKSIRHAIADLCFVVQVALEEWQTWLCHLDSTENQYD